MKEIVKKIVDALEDKKAVNIRILDISKISSMADYFIIANGNNKNQVQALSDSVNEEMLKLGKELKQTEGYRSANWILMDYEDIIVHIFDQENRLFYDLERIWRDGIEVRIEDL